MKTPGSYHKPLAALELTGATDKNPKRFADRSASPSTGKPVGPAPKGMSKEQKAIWKELVNSSAPSVLESSDRLVLELAVRQIESLRTNKASAALQGILLGTLQQLGLTPIARQRIAITKPSTEPSVWDTLLSPTAVKN